MARDARPNAPAILKQLSYEASFLKRMREQFPTLEKVAVPSSGGVAFRIVMAMNQHFAGEARAALLAAMTANMRPKIVIVVDPDIDVHDPVQVDWACAFRMQPARDMIRTAGARPVSRDICGPALAEKGHEYIEVADVPGWREYEFPELKGR